MTDEQKTRTPEEEKKARIKRCIAIVVIGAVSVWIFFYLAGGIVELLMADAYVPTEGEQPEM